MVPFRRLRQPSFAARIIVGFLLCMLGFAGNLFGAQVLDLNFPRKKSIQPYLEYWIDAENSAGIDAVIAGDGKERFVPIGAKKGFGYSRATFWFRFSTVNNASETVTWYLEHAYPVTDEIDFYYPGPKGLQKYQSGDFRPFSVRPVFFRTSVFPVSQAPGIQTVYIRIKSNGSIAIPFKAWQEKAFTEHKYADIAFNWIYYGIILATIFYNFFIYLSVREHSYLYLIMFIIGSSIFTMAHSGLAFQYLWPYYSWWANVCHPFFGFIGLVGSVLFTRSFLVTRETFPGFDRILGFLTIAGLIFILSPFFLEYHYATQLLAIFGMLSTVTMIYGGVVLYLRGLRQSRFFLLAWTSYACSVLLMFMKSFGFFPSNLLTDSGVQIGTGMLVVFFSFGLADKINTIQKERQKALEEVRESEKRYRLLAENVKDIIWTMDFPTMQYRYITPSVQGFRGFTCEEAMQLPLAKTLTPGSLATVKKEMTTELGREQQGKFDPNRSLTMELEYYHKNGATVWAEVTISFLRDPHGRPIGITGVTRDITERRKADKERRSLELKLQQAQKMEAIGTLAGGIAHDFNNILSAIMGNIEISLAGAARESKLAVRLRRVLEACERAKDLVLQILMFSRQGDQTPKPVYMNYIVAEVLKLIRASLPSTITIKKEISKERKIVLSDPIHIHQVVMNLCSNASDAMRASGGVLAVSLDSLFLDAEAAKQYHDLLPGEYVRLTVSDTGEGMEPEVVERIFEPFFTTKEQGRGTGMGLSLVHGIVTKMGGAVHVTSAPGKGAVFQVFFPRVIEAPVEDNEEETETPTGKEHILLVDDEQDIVDMAQEMFSEMGYHVTATTSSTEALSLFEKQPDAFDLVISDQTMPNITGINLARSIRKLRPEIPVILCTGFSDTIDQATIETVGIQNLVLKPYSKKEISHLIRRVLDKIAASA